MINELLLRVEYNDVTYDLIVDNQVPLRLDMSAIENQELGKFFGVGSQTFSLPGTKQTNRFFNYAYDVSTDDVPAAYNTLQCSVILNGETILIGVLQLMEVITNEDGYVTYQVQVVDTVLQFEQALSSKLIKDGNWLPYEHLLTSQSVINSWTGDLLSGSVYYPLVDYGRTQEESLYVQAPIMQISSSLASMNNQYIGDISSPLNLRQVLPAVRVKDTMDVIFNQAGFTYTGSFTETEDFNNLYILNKPKEGLGVVTSTSATVDFTAGATGNQTEGDGYYYVVSASSEILDPSNSYNTTTSTYTVPESGQYTFQGQVGFFNPVPVASGGEVFVNFTLGLDVDGIPDNDTPLDTVVKKIRDTTGIGPYYLNVAYTGIFSAGQKVRLTGNMDQLLAGPDTITFLQTSTQFKAINTPTTYEGATVDMSLQWQAATKSVDILKGIITQFNLVMTPQLGNSSVIEIETFDDWIRAGNIKDWTSKYNTAKRISISHTVDELEKELFLKNIDDNDRFSKNSIEQDPNQQYGTLRLLADNTVSQGTRDVKSFFSPIILGGSVEFVPDGTENWAGTYNINYNTRFVIPHIYKWNNKTQEAYTSKSRIGYKVTAPLLTGDGFYIGSPATATHITGSYTTISNTSALPVVSGSTNDLHFNSTYTPFTGAALNLNQGVSNFTNYWKTYLDSLYWQGSRKVTLDLFFNEYEYKSIQLNDRILIKNQVYRINKISGFNVSHRDVVKVELIKLYPAYWQLQS